MNKDAIRRYLLPDSHFYHKNMGQFCGRPDDFAKRIVKNIKYIVRPQDEIIFLGDVIFGNKSQLKEILDILPGRKILTKGNHDRHSDTWFYNAGFDFVCDSTTIGQYVLSHFPIDIPNGKINIHGHFHNVPANRWEPYLVERLTDNHYLCSIELADYQPILLYSALSSKGIVKSLEFPK